MPRLCQPTLIDTYCCCFNPTSFLGTTSVDSCTCILYCCAGMLYTVCDVCSACCRSETRYSCVISEIDTDFLIEVDTIPMNKKIRTRYIQFRYLIFDRLMLSVWYLQTRKRGCQGMDGGQTRWIVYTPNDPSIYRNFWCHFEHRSQPCGKPYSS